MKKRKGLVCQADDFEIGGLYTVLGFKNQPNLHVAYAGQAFKIKAINLPFVVVDMVGADMPATLDTRLLNVMKVSKEFAEAQLVDSKQQKQYEMFR